MVPPRFWPFAQVGWIGSSTYCRRVREQPPPLPLR